MSAARLFVALDLPVAIRDDLARWGAACAVRDSALRAVRPEGLHLTLHFLGAREESEIPGLARALAACADGLAGVTGTLEGALWLAPRRPHVLTCAVEDVSGAMGALHEALGPALADTAEGWIPERRALRPHVTVARVRRGERPRVGDEPGAPDGSFACPSATLYRSILGAGGARYEALERIPLPG